MGVDLYGNETEEKRKETIYHARRIYAFIIKSKES